MSYEYLLTEQRGPVRILTLHRPEVLNSLHQPLLRELEDALDAAAADPLTRGVILTGSGTKAFAAGADIAEFTDQDPEATYMQSRRVQQFFAQKIEGAPKPVLAAVNGFALGGGFELALACHIRLASDNARFGLPEIKLGLIPGYGGTQRLQRLIGHGRAIRYTLTAEMIAADEAERIGLVTAVHPQAELLDASLALLDKILAHSASSARYVIQAVNAAHSATDGFDLEAHLFSEAMNSPDGREGVAAFLAKRPPVFSTHVQPAH